MAWFDGAALGPMAITMDLCTRVDGKRLSAFRTTPPRVDIHAVVITDLSVCA